MTERQRTNSSSHSAWGRAQEGLLEEVMSQEITRLMFCWTLPQQAPSQELLRNTMEIKGILIH